MQTCADDRRDSAGAARGGGGGIFRFSSSCVVKRDRCQQAFSSWTRLLASPVRCLWACSTLTRSSVGLPTEAFGNISCVFYVNVNPDAEVDSPCAVRTWNLNIMSSNLLYLAATCPCAIATVPRKLLDEFQALSYVKCGVGSRGPFSQRTLHLENWTLFPRAALIAVWSGGLRGISPVLTRFFRTPPRGVESRFFL